MLPLPHADIILFCLSMSTIMSTPPPYFKNTYIKILRFLFGNDVWPETKSSLKKEEVPVKDKRSLTVA